MPPRSVGGALASARPLPIALVIAAALLAGACSSRAGLEDLRGLYLGGLDAPHDGPVVAAGSGGPARFARALYTAFEPQRAMATVAFADRWWREPGNEGFEATLDHVEATLSELGFGADARLELEVIETELDAPAWTPRSASLELLDRAGRGRRVLHRFDKPGDRDRTMLPANAPSAEVEAPFAIELDELDAGEVLVTERGLGSVLRAARERGAVAVLSAALADYNVDPTGKGRHRDAILYASVRPGTELPVGQISPRAFEALRAARGGRLRFRAEAELRPAKLRTLVATVVGEGRGGEAVALAAHVQEPGAVDNASGVGGQLEGVRALLHALRGGRFPWPRRSLAFVWGDEMEMSRVFLEHGAREVVAAFSSDMTGASRALTGAMPLLERAPDPGALRPLPPDEHTAWGAGPVEREDLVPSGINVVARLAMVDVGRASGRDWETREHPWEGGSDHDVFLRHGVPAVLVWHFTDFAYHTSLDRLEHVDAEELRRTSVALLAAALAVAAPLPTDLERYLESLDLERRLRIQAAREAGDAELEVLWQEWCDQARGWLRALCLDLPFDDVPR